MARELLLYSSLKPGKSSRNAKSNIGFSPGFQYTQSYTIEKMDELENESDDSSTTPEKYSTTKTNYLVLSDAGKLIFSQYGDDTSLCTICGLIQTVRVTSLNDASLSFGDLQCIHTDSSMLVFMSVGSIILVAISFKDDDGFSDTVDYFRLKLECIYSAIIFTLTDEVQYMLLNDPQLDISYLLGSTTSKIRNLLDDMDLGDDSSTGRRSCCWLGGVDIISPMPAEVRYFLPVFLFISSFRNLLTGFSSPLLLSHFNTFDLDTQLHIQSIGDSMLEKQFHYICHLIHQ